MLTITARVRSSAANSRSHCSVVIIAFIHNSSALVAGIVEVIECAVILCKLCNICVFQLFNVFLISSRRIYCIGKFRIEKCIFEFFFFRFQRLHRRFVLRDRCLCIRILFFGLDLRELIIDRGLGRLKLLESGLGRRFLRGKLRSVHGAVLTVNRKRFIISFSGNLYVAVFLRRRVSGFDQALVVILLQRFQISLGLLQFIRILRFQHEERVADVDLLAGLDQHACDLAGLLDRDVIDLAGLDGSLTADAGVDCAGGHLLRSDLGQRGVHDRFREKGQHQQHGQQDDGRGFDPFAFSYTVFHISFPYPFTEPECAIPSTRYASPCKNSRRPGIM